MSLKENVNFVKEELSSEEKFLESFVKIERFFKKYKLLIISAVAVAVVVIIALSVTSYLREQNKIEANIVFQEVIKNPTNTKALESLKELNMGLYEIALFNQKSTQKDLSISTPFFKELLEYEKAIKEQDVKKLNDISMENNFLLKEFAIFNKALILANEGKYQEAKDTLKLIPETSQVKDLVSLLNHYLITK